MVEKIFKNGKWWCVRPVEKWTAGSEAGPYVKPSLSSDASIAALNVKPIHLNQLNQ